jgi:hypothetical protein
MIHTAEQTREAYRLADELLEVAKLETLIDSFEVVQTRIGHSNAWHVARHVKGRLIESEVFDNAADARQNLIERLMCSQMDMSAEPITA